MNLSQGAWRLAPGAQLTREGGKCAKARSAGERGAEEREAWEGPAAWAQPLLWSRPGAARLVEAAR